MPPPVAYPPHARASATELAAGPARSRATHRRGYRRLPGRSCTPCYDEQLTHTQRALGPAGGGAGITLRPAGGITRAALGQPGGGTRAPTAGPPGLADRRGRGRRAGLRRGRGLRGREDRARARRCADRLRRHQSGRCHVAGHVPRPSATVTQLARRGRHGDPRFLPGPERLRAVDRPTRDQRRTAVLGKPGERRSHPPAGHRHPPGHPERPAHALGVRAAQRIPAGQHAHHRDAGLDRRR